MGGFRRMPDVRVRKFLVSVEDIHHEGGPVADVPLRRGAVLAVIQSLRGSWRSVGGGLAQAVDPPYLALRETLGAAWALRICERFNGLATERGWPCRLRFAGLAGDLTVGPSSREVLRCFRSIVRRFANSAWIARHGGLGLPEVGRGRPEG